MAVVNEPDNTPLPGTVFTPRQVRVLKIAVIVMGLLLVGGFAFVLAAIVYQASKGEQSSTPSGEEAVAAELHIPKDCTRVRLNSGRRSERKRSSLTPAWLASASA